MDKKEKTTLGERLAGRMGEKEGDLWLHIDTCGREDYQEDKVHYPYEPTPYQVLERLAEEEILTEEDFLLDYGCGKGRVPLFFAKRVGCRGMGVECDPLLYEKAQANALLAGLEKKVSFCRAGAEDLEVPEKATAFFFFNPFGEVILRRVLDQLRESFYDSPREMRLLFYYPDPDQVALLMGREELMFSDEVDMSDLFPSHPERERVLIFELEG